jgi:hypothetical protein
MNPHDDDEPKPSEEQLRTLEEADDKYNIKELNITERGKLFEDQWLASGGTPEQWEDLKLWELAEQFASARSQGTPEVLGLEIMKAADELMAEALAALKAGKLPELKDKWFPSPGSSDHSINI